MHGCWYQANGDDVAHYFDHEPYDDALDTFIVSELSRCGESSGMRALSCVEPHDVGVRGVRLCPKCRVRLRLEVLELERVRAAKKRRRA